MTLETSEYVRDAGAVLLEKLSNHRSVELAEKRNRIAPDLDGRLGVTMRLEATRRRFEDSILLDASGQWIPVLIRETMSMVEETARFKAPKYISAYVDVLKLFLTEVGREDLIDEDFDIGVALEFGVSSTTLLSLMELGLSRMSAVALYEKIARDDLDRDGCLAWINEHAPNFAGMDLPGLIVRETLEVTANSRYGESEKLSE